MDIFGFRWHIKGWLPNLTTRGTCLFNNRNTKMAVNGAQMNLEGWNLVKMDIFWFRWLLLGWLPNLTTRRTCLSSNRNAKMGVDRAEVNLFGPNLLKMDICRLQWLLGGQWMVTELWWIFYLTIRTIEDNRGEDCSGLLPLVSLKASTCGCLSPS